MAKSGYQSGRVKPGLHRDYPMFVGTRHGQTIPRAKQRRLLDTTIPPRHYIKGGDMRKQTPSLRSRRNALARDNI